MKNDANSVDLTLTFGSFETTSCKVEAISDAGRAFLAQRIGAGAIGCEIPKSRTPEFAAAVRGAGLELETR